MNEDGTTASAADAAAEETGSVTEAEVLEVLGKSAPEAAEEDTTQEEATETAEAEEATETEIETAETQATTEEAKTEETAATETEAEAPTFTVDIEDANGKKFTVHPDDNLEEVLADFEPKNNGQVLQLMRELDRLGNEKSEYEAKQQENAANEARAKEIAAYQESWDKEVQKLQGEKRLPLDAKIEDRKKDVFRFMAEENDKRQEEGRPLLMSFEDALDKLELKEAKDAKEQKAKEEKEANKKRGGLVGGSSAPASSGGPTYVAGTARNASEALRSMGLL